MQKEMQIAEAGHGESLPKLVDQFRVEFPDFRLDKRDLIHKMRSSAEIDGGGHKRFVHRQRKMPVTANPRFVSERLNKRLAKRNSNIFGQMVPVNMNIPRRPDFQVNERMPREKRECMVEKAEAGLDFGRTGPVEIELKRNVRFLRFSCNYGMTHF